MQSEAFRNNVLTVTYSGQRGRDLLIYHDLNASPIADHRPIAVHCLSKLRSVSSAIDVFSSIRQRNVLFRHVISANNAGTSQYDSLQASYNQRELAGLDTQYNLTWSKCYDYNSVNRGGRETIRRSIMSIPSAALLWRLPISGRPRTLRP